MDRVRTAMEASAFGVGDGVEADDLAPHVHRRHKLNFSSRSGRAG